MKYIKETVNFLKERGFENPEVGIILGTGLGQLLDKVNIFTKSVITTFLISQQRQLSFIKVN